MLTFSIVIRQKMAERNNNGGDNTSNKKKTLNNNFFRMRNRFHNNRNTGPRQNAMSFLLPSGSPSSTTSDSTSNTTSTEASTSLTSFRINKKTIPYVGWQLYFPEIGNFDIESDLFFSFSFKYFIFIFFFFKQIDSLHKIFHPK